LQQLRRLFDQAGVGCALLDPSDRIVRINAALAELLGYAAAELAGGDWSKLVLGDTGAAPGRQRPDPDQTVHLLHRDGTPIAVRLLVEPVEGALLLQVLPAATRADSAGQAT
jgi:PAS domain S-box-containing protein